MSDPTALAAKTTVALYHHLSGPAFANGLFNTFRVTVAVSRQLLAPVTTTLYTVVSTGFATGSLMFVSDSPVEGDHK
jgi:hypothetical protein